MRPCLTRRRCRLPRPKVPNGQKHAASHHAEAFKPVPTACPPSRVDAFQRLAQKNPPSHDNSGEKNYFYVLRVTKGAGPCYTARLVFAPCSGVVRRIQAPSPVTREKTPLRVILSGGEVAKRPKRSRTRRARSAERGAQSAQRDLERVFSMQSKSKKRDKTVRRSSLKTPTPGYFFAQDNT